MAVAVAYARSVLAKHATYEENLLRLLEDHAIAPRWERVSVAAGGRRSSVWVMADAVQIELGLIDGTVVLWRPAVSAYVAQVYADGLGAMLPTQRIVDSTLSSANTVIAPQTQTITWDFSGSVEHSMRCSRAIREKAIGDPGLVENVGKYWILHNGLRLKPRGTACNYGWFARWGPSVCEPSRVQCYQQPGYHHDLHHWDYSQTLRLVRRAAEVDGAGADLGDVLVDPATAPLWNYEGVIWSARQG